MDASIEYLKNIHEAVANTENAKGLAPMDLCKKVCGKLGLPSMAVNLLVAKSLQSNIAAEFYGREPIDDCL